MEQKSHNLQTALMNAKYHSELTLSEDIWRVLIARDKRVAQRRGIGYALVGIASFLLFFPAVITLFRQFNESGFSEYLSLGFSDSASMMLYWKEFIWTLADALPATSLLLSLSLIAVFLVCVRRASRYMRSPLVTA